MTDELPEKQQRSTCSRSRTSSVMSVRTKPGATTSAVMPREPTSPPRSITREVGSRGITANVVAPGFVRTDMTDELPEKQQKEYLQQIPAKRFAEPDEVAKVVLLLLLRQLVRHVGADEARRDDVGGDAAGADLARVIDRARPTSPHFDEE